LRDYQRRRVLAFIDPSSDPDSVAAYNAEQAVMAIRSGGLHGQGWGRGVLNRLGRVPERYADFIFPVIAEEWGFWRTALVMAGYWIFTCLIAWVAWTARDPMGRLLASGVLTLFVVQSFLHMAISLRLAPITGLTLPLVSYGGSSLLSTYAGLGLVASVATHPAEDMFG
jgi:rod shape determining protein RodA